MSPARKRQPRCFGEILEDGSVLLPPEEEHHLLKVIRIEIGEEIELVHEGRLFLLQVSSKTRHKIDFQVLHELETELLPVLPIHLAPAVLHASAMERMIHQATELHVASITPLWTERTQSHSVAPKMLERWRKIAQEACKQAKRIHVPPIAEPQSLDSWLAEPSATEATSLRLCLSPVMASWSPAQPKILPAKGIFLMQGPEGGWTEPELEKIQSTGCHLWSLGKAVFRAETCPVVALTLLHQSFDGLFST